LKLKVSGISNWYRTESSNESIQCAGKEIIRQRDVANLNVLIAPLVEELDGANLVGDVLWENGIAAWALNLDFFRVLRHDDCEL
jgi:hypothetical protein